MDATRQGDRRQGKRKKRPAMSEPPMLLLAKPVLSEVEGNLYTLKYLNNEIHEKHEKARTKTGNEERKLKPELSSRGVIL
jgi:hypothetical protein